MTDEIPEPRLMRVPCYNAPDGCTNTVSYMGVREVKKLCSSCLDSGPPIQHYRTIGVRTCDQVKNLRKKMNGWPVGLHDGPIVAITARPMSKTPDGRVGVVRGGGNE